MESNLNKLSASSFFSLLVIDENPDDIILKYDMLTDVDTPYILYEYSDMKNIRTNKIKIYKEMSKKCNNKNTLIGIHREILKLKSMTDEEHYEYLGELNSYDSNKNIISTENPNGKWITCDKGGKLLSNYMKDFNDNGVISAKKSEIDWELTHLRSDKLNTINRTWDLCVNNIKPENEKDENIMKNMSKYKNYFSNFKNKEEYCKMLCSFWTYAVIINGTWVDMEFENEFNWIINFYDIFIKNLDNNSKITIYECTR